MQHKSLALHSISAHLKALRLKKQWTWKQLASALELSDVMVYQVASGRRALSDRATYRLAELEREAGIEPVKIPLTIEEIAAKPAGQVTEDEATRWFENQTPEKRAQFVEMFKALEAHGPLLKSLLEALAGKTRK